MRRIAGLAGVMTLAAALAATTSTHAAPVRGLEDPGVTPTTIVLGGTASLAGPGAAAVRGAEAYFKYVNARGGVNGRKITYKVVDDAGSPAQALQATRQLVEQEKVLAVFNSVGTEQSLAVRDYLNAAKVPQLLAASGANGLGTNYDEYPYTSGLQPSHQAEAWVYGKYVARTRPRARVAVLFQHDTYGKELLAGLRRGLQRSKARIVAAQPYEATAADVGPQIAKLRAARADTLALFATPKHAVQAYASLSRIGWKPRLVINSAASSAASVMQLATLESTPKLVNGTLSVAFLKDPTDPRWRSDGGVRLYRQVMKQYLPSANADDALHVYGMAAAWTAVALLEDAGKTPTREALLEAVDTMDMSGSPFLLPGVELKTAGERDHFPIEQMLLQRWQKGTWNSFGGLWSHRAP